MGLASGQGRRSKHSPKSSSSTVLWDPATSLEDWKQQIKVKGSIPANQQRLTFTSPRVSKQTSDLAHLNQSSKWQIVVDATVEELLKDLQSWHAVLHADNTSAKLLCPLVLSEKDELAFGLHSKTAQELRQIGVPCNVFYLSFDKWIPAGQFGIPGEETEGNKELREINIQVDKNLQKNSICIDLYGHLNGECLPFPISYHMSGKELDAKLSMVEQTVQYRLGQKMRHHLATPILEDLHSSVGGGRTTEVKTWRSGLEDYVIRCEKNREFSAIISSEHHQLRCIILTVITIPLDASRCSKESSSMQCVKGALIGGIDESHSDTSAALIKGDLPSSSKKAEKSSSSARETRISDYGHIQDNLSGSPSESAATVTSGLEGPNQVSSTSLPVENLAKGSKKKKKKKGKKNSRGKTNNVAVLTHGEGSDVDEKGAVKKKLNNDCSDFHGSSIEYYDSNLLSREKLDVKSPVEVEVNAAHQEMVQVHVSKSEGLEHLDDGYLCGKSSRHLEDVNEQPDKIGLIGSNLTSLNTVEHKDDFLGFEARSMSVLGPLDELSNSSSKQSDHPCNSNCEQKNGFVLSGMIASFVGDKNGIISTVPNQKQDSEIKRNSPANGQDTQVRQSFVGQVNALVLGQNSGMGGVFVSGENGDTGDEVDCGWSDEFLQDCKVNEENGSCRKDKTTCDNNENQLCVQSSAMFDSQTYHYHRKIGGKRYGMSGGSDGCTTNSCVASSGDIGIYSGSGKENSHAFWQRVLKPQPGEHSKEVKSLAAASGIGQPIYTPHDRYISTNCTPAVLSSAHLVAQNGSVNLYGKGKMLKELEKCQDSHPQKSSVSQNSFNNQSNGDQSLNHFKSQLQMKERSNTGNGPGSNLGKGFWARKRTEGQGHPFHKNSESLSVFQAFPDGNSRPVFSYRRRQKSDLQQVDQQWSRSVPTTPGLEEVSADGRCIFPSSQMRTLLSSPRTSDSLQPPRAQCNYPTKGTRQHAKFQFDFEESSLHSTSPKAQTFSQLDQGMQHERIGDRDDTPQHCAQKWIAVETQNKDLLRSNFSQATLSVDVNKALANLSSNGDRNLNTSVISSIELYRNVDTSMSSDLSSSFVRKCPMTGCRTVQKADQNFTGGSAASSVPCAAAQDHSLLLMSSAQNGGVGDHSSKLLHSFNLKENAREVLEDVKAPQFGVKSTTFESSELELKHLACKVLKAIHASCESRAVCENVSSATGSPLGEFEKVLQAVAPAFKSSPTNFQTRNTNGSCCIEEVAETCKKASGHSVCTQRVSDVALSTIWQWYEEPSCFGLEVKTVDHQHPGRSRTTENQSQAFFIPYLSGMQLFGYSRQCNFSRNEDAKFGQRVEGKDNLDFEFRNLPILATLLPKPKVADDVDFEQTPESEASKVPTRQKVKGPRASYETCSCGSYTDDLEHDDVHLLYEFFDGEKPQQRRPFFDRIKELVKGQVAPDSRSSGDARVLDSVKLGELHSASWFSVAWYPVYRIPDGTLRAAFLTYHSLSHFLCRCTSSSTFRGFSDCCLDTVTAPVVGLMSYNAQAEQWFSLASPYRVEGHNLESSDLNPSEVLQHHLAKLEAAAATMARGSCDQASTFQYKHLDYSFFVSRRR